MKNSQITRRPLVATALGMGMVAALAFTGSPSVAAPSCPQTSSPKGWTGSTLDTDTTKDGVVYDGTYNRLGLSPDGGNFKSTSIAFTDATFTADSGDFDQDGWTDFVSVTPSGIVRIYRNKTFQSPATTANWADTNFVRTPVFTPYTGTLRNAVGTSGDYEPIGVGDLNGDGWPDVVSARANTNNNPYRTDIWLNSRSVSAGTASFQTGYSAVVTSGGVAAPAGIGKQTNTGTVILADINGDKKLDLLFGAADGSGTINAFLNQCTTVSPLPSPLPNANGMVPCANNPTFVKTATPFKSGVFSGMSGSGSGNNWQPIFRLADVTSDGLKDLIVSTRECCNLLKDRLRIFRGVAGTGIQVEATVGMYVPDVVGGITAIMVTDFSLDGKPDIIVGNDLFNYNGGVVGGSSYYFKNNGTATPFSGGVTQQLTAKTGSSLCGPTMPCPATDFDVGFIFDYDNDPNHSPDLLLADGNSAGQYYTLANRVTTKYVECGDAASGVMDLGTLADSELVVTAARITPTMYVPSGASVTFYLSNETPENWVQASLCTGSTTDYCVNFPKPIGRSVKWKAKMCSNAARTATPLVSGMSATFDFTEATQHYRAGSIVNDGISYVGAFSQPGDRGHFYAVDAALNLTYWDAAAKLDAMADGDRHLYTSSIDGMSRLDFVGSNSTNADLRTVLGAANATQAKDVIDWVRSPRFGVGNVGISLTKLGAIETSTPAILVKPPLPTWYAFATPTDRTRINQFATEQTDRIPLVFVGAKDGLMHAMYSFATNVSDVRNGQEAWGFVPPLVAGGMVADYTNSQFGTNVVGNYPDGSPTLLDMYLPGSIKTVALIGSGNGGRGLAALDVTQTVTATGPTTNTIQGPTPMWSVTPGGSTAGRSRAKPAVARVSIGGVISYVAVAGSGLDPLDNTKGRVVSGYNLATGALLWNFTAACAITSDITVFETDDAGEPGAPKLDGLVDRAIFADYCGNVYKIPVNQDLAGGWLTNSGYGSRLVANANGAPSYAIFTSKYTASALGNETPISGTIAARTDPTTRMVLFFGTGGLEDWPSTTANGFFAVYADTGEVRSKIIGTCASGKCEKFYGGVVVTPEQVIVTRTIDAVVGTGACDFGSSKVQGMKLAAGVGTNFVNDFSVDVSSAVASSLYGDAGALYFATLSGEVARIGTPRASSAGDDTANGSGGGMSVADDGTEFTGGSATSALVSLGWRQVL